MDRALYDDAWLRFRLFDEMSWHPERLGKRRRIFATRSISLTADMYLEPASPEPHREWKLNGGDPIQSLFSHLRALASRNEASILYATNDDGAFLVPHWEREFSAEHWTPDILSEFETTPAEQGGTQHLVLLFRARQSAVIFTKHSGLQIDYYGSTGMWQELSDMLYRKVARPSNGS